MYHRHYNKYAIILFVVVVILPTFYCVDSLVVPTVVSPTTKYVFEKNHVNDGSMKPIDASKDAVQQRSRFPQQSKAVQYNQVVPKCCGVLLGLITLFAPLNIPVGLSPSTIANAADSKIVGSFSGSGLFFKDTLQVEAFDDPKVQGVKLYVSNFILPINERLSSTKNLFSDPSSASLTCAKTGPIKIADNIVKGTGGEQVFEESKSLLFKSLKVQRVYDEEDQTLIYVSYNTRLDKNDDSNKSRFKSSLCAIGLE
jgi:catabolite regulation protein CreA